MKHWIFWPKYLKGYKFYTQIAKKNSSKNTKTTPFFYFIRKNQTKLLLVINKLKPITLLWQSLLGREYQTKKWSLNEA